MEYLAITSRAPDGSARLAGLKSRPGLYFVGGITDDTGIRQVLMFADDGMRATLQQQGFDVTVVTDTRNTEDSLTNARAQIGATPAQPLPHVRGEFSTELLQAALEIARTRLNDLAIDTLTSGQALATRLGVPGGADVGAELAVVIKGIDTLSATVENGARIPAADLVKAALTPFGDTITALAAAVLALGGNLDALLTGAVGQALELGDGVLHQLGVPAAGGSVTAAPGDVSYRISAQPPAIAGIDADTVTLTARLHYSGGPPMLGLGIALTGLRVAPGGAGALLSALGIGGDIAADLTVAVDTTSGLTFGGTSTGRITLPARKRAGPVTVRGLALDIGRSGETITLDLIALVEGSLGPIRMVVDGAGLRMAVDTAKTEPLQRPSILPPTGFGIRIDAGPVAGGGYLAKRPAPAGISSYGGALNLRLGPVDVNAFGLLTDGPAGFSFVVVMSVEVCPPIELGLLFTLNGVGGIIGVNVSADTNAMRAQLQSGTLSQLMFPADPVGAAPGILDTLAASFPTDPGGFVIGPMVKLGWGRPVSFITAELALVLSIADPKVILLGRLRVAIPDPVLPLIDLKAEIFGEFSADRVLVLAALVDSHIGFLSVAGDFGLLLRLGGDADFTMSAGGFHPRYQAPAELAGLRRISAELSPPFFHLRVEAYVAVATNSIQFGGRLEIGYGVAGTGVFGHAGLDALLRWGAKGLTFEVDLVAGVAVKAFDISLASVELRLHLEGPGPWLARGTGTVGLPWPLPDVTIDVGPVSWGSGGQPPPPLVSPHKLVAEALSQPGAWQASSANRSGGVRLRPDPTPPAGVILVEPWSLLEGRQSAVPLDTDIVRVGGSRVTGGTARVSLDTVTVGAPTPPAPGAPTPTPVRSPVSDRFAPGQYLDLTDDDQLRRPAFESFSAGVRIDPVGLTDVDSRHASRATLRYETVFPHRSAPILTEEIIPGAASDLRLDAAAAGTCELRAEDRYRAVTSGLHMAPAEQVVVRSRTDLRPVPEVADAAMTWTHAQEQIGRHPAVAADLQIVGLGAGR